MANENTGIGLEGAAVANDMMAEEVAQEISVTTTSVRIAADNVLSAVALFKEAQDNAKEMAELLSNSTGESAVLEISQRVQTADTRITECYRFLMEKIFLLQNEVNAFLGQTVQMVYVYKGAGGVVELWKVDNSVEDLTIGKASSKKGGDPRGRYMLSKKRLQQLGATQISAAEGYDPTSLRATYAEILRRKQNAREKNAGGSYTGVFYILWNEGSGWHGVRVSSEGVLAESYAGFFLDSIVFDDGVETNVKTFMTDSTHGAIMVDNKSGFLEGDVSTNDGQMQYGIKTRGASALGYARIVQEAQNIVALGKDIAAPDLRELLMNLKKTLADEGTTHLATRLEDCVDLDVDAIIKTFEKNLTLGKDAKISIFKG